MQKNEKVKKNKNTEEVEWRRHDYCDAIHIEKRMYTQCKSWMSK